MEIRKILKFLSVIVVVGLTRLLPHPPNMAPIGALALFSGANLAGFPAFIFPLSVMFLSDLFLGFHTTIPFVYLSFVLIVFIGKRIKKNKFRSLVFSSIISSVLFYVVTNFGVWISTSMYVKNINGLFACYLLGIPFFKNTLLGDLFYSVLVFYGFDYFIIYFKKACFFIKTSFSQQPEINRGG